MVPVSFDFSLPACQVNKFPLRYITLADTLVDFRLLIFLPMIKPIAGKGRTREEKNQRNSHDGYFNRM